MEKTKKVSKEHASSPAPVNTLKVKEDVDAQVLGLRDRILNKSFEAEMLRRSPDWEYHKYEAANRYEESLSATKELYVKHLDRAIEIFKKEPTILDIKAQKAIVVGDLHGDLFTFWRIIHKYPPNEYTYILLGDFVDRGREDAELLAVLLANKILYPENFMMLRGNHEAPMGTVRPQEFPDRLLRQHGFGWDALHKVYYEVFPELPIAAVLNDKYFMVHGGIPLPVPKLDTLKKLNKVFDPDMNLETLQMLWNDMSADKGFKKSGRTDGAYIIGQDIADNFLRKNGLKMIIRGHERVPGGYSLDNNVLTLLTTVYYTGTRQYIAKIEGENLELLEVSSKHFAYDFAGQPQHLDWGNFEKVEEPRSHRPQP